MRREGEYLIRRVIAATTNYAQAGEKVAGKTAGGACGTCKRAGDGDYCSSDFFDRLFKIYDCRKGGGGSNKRC